jgi:hypothetical protein
MDLAAAAVHGGAGLRRRRPYAFRTPRNTGADPFTNPVTFDRHAACGRYCPNVMLGTDANAAAWNAISCLCRSASFGAFTRAS